MVFEFAEELPGTGSYVLRRMDHLETGIFCESKRISVWNRIRLDDSIRQVRHNPDLVRAWLVLFFFLATAGALLKIVWGHW